MSARNRKTSRGFTILELMIGMFIFLVITGAVLGGMAGLQKNYRTNEMRDNMQSRLRATMELMEQEIGQAGLQASTVEGDYAVSTGGAPYISNTTIASGNQTVSLNKSTGLFVGQWLMVGAGTDAIQLTGVNGTANTITATFGAQHNGTVTSPVPIYPLGIFPHGVMAGSAGDPSDAVNGTSLVLYGDLHGSGNGLWAAEYKCSPPNLIRYEWNLDAASPNGSMTQATLLNTVQSCQFCWPGSGAAGCATDALANANGGSVAENVTVTVPSDYPNSSFHAGLCTTSAPYTCTYTMITQVSFTITTSETDTTTTSATNGTTLTMSKNYSNIQPRNIIAADRIYEQTSNTTVFSGELQPDPTVLSSITWQ